MIVAAVNAHTGELAAFDRNSGVDLVDAVTAGTALPGVVPTDNINGTRYFRSGGSYDSVEYSPVMANRASTGGAAARVPLRTAPRAYHIRKESYAP
jgi:predicted acylesterase/phospholipase RssA